MLFIFSVDPSQSQAGLSQWITGPEIGTAAITALFTLAAILFKDYLLKRINEGRSDRKSEAAIYRRALDILGKPAERVLFIDDRAENVAGAAAAGMQTIHFEGATGLLRELENLRVL